MLTQLFVLLFLSGHVFTKEPPDVDCLVIHLNYVHCSWNKQGIPAVNYTFFGWFSKHSVSECPTYLSEGNTNTGCNQPYGDRINRFKAFRTKLVHGNQSFPQEHALKDKVKLNPPTNLTVQYGSDSNLWFSWSQIFSKCVESEVRHRINKKKWEPLSQISLGVQTYCINLPSNNTLYEMQVRSKLDYTCGGSIYWSDWTEPVPWVSNSTETNQVESLFSVWNTVLYVLGAFILVLLVMVLLHHERVRIIPVVPRPSAKLHNVEDWFQFPKGLKESINYNERPCPVREYCHVPQSDSDSSDCSTCSVTTDQTDCSINVPVNNSDLSTPCTSSTSTVSPVEEKQICA